MGPGRSSGGRRRTGGATVRNGRTQVWPGQQGKTMTGTLAATATAVALMLEGDRGHWILPAGAPDAFAPGESTFAAALALAPDLPVGEHVLLVRAVQPGGRYGPAWREPLRCPGSAGGRRSPGGRPGGLPALGHERRPGSARRRSPGGRGVGPQHQLVPGPAAGAGGQIRRPGAGAGSSITTQTPAAPSTDARQRKCRLDRAAPAGRYVVRVDAASLCGQPAARWTAQVATAGTVAAQASGTMVEANTRGKHGPGGGLLVFTFTYP